ncbi:hypothetical protein TNCV_1875731 [Trichonephila clavipes]|nr:hypothetical protein TNCV_1875731 [Trichonephila clavipes]
MNCWPLWVPSLNDCRIDTIENDDYDTAVYQELKGIIPEPEVTRRLAKHRYSQLRIAPNSRIIHPKGNPRIYSPISEGNSGFRSRETVKQRWTTTSILSCLRIRNFESIERRSVFIPEHRNNDLDELDEDDFRRRFTDFIKAPSRRL